MLLSIIIINYKTFDLTKSCLNSLYDLIPKEIGRNVEIIVVDNGSGDDDVKSLQKFRDDKNFKLMLSDRNLGFAAGCNFGASLAAGEILLFLNSDTEVKDGIIEMADQIERGENLGALGGKIVSQDGKTEKSAGKFYNLWHLLIMLLGGERFGLDRFAPDKYSRVDWVSGGFIMVRKNIFDKLSGFDEDYFMYLEDMDLCLRASKAGYKTYYFPNASIIHKKHGSSNRKFAIINIYRSLKIFYKKNQSQIGYNIAITMLFLKALLVFSLAKVIGNRDLSQTYEEVLKLF